jgi:hypothetical protein
MRTGDDMDEDVDAMEEDGKYERKTEGVKVVGD